MRERYQLRCAAGAYWLLDMQQKNDYKKPFMLNECGAYIYRAYISGMGTDDITQAFADAYDIPFLYAKEDVEQFLGQLKEQGIIVGME